MSGGETGGVHVLNRGERGSTDLLLCSHDALEAPSAGGSAGAVPHSDGAGQDALYSSSVEVGHNGGRDSGSSQFAEKVETL